MNRKHLWLALLIIATALPGSARDTPSWRLGFDGIGPIRIGMRFDEVNRSAGRSLRHAYNPNNENRRCEYLPSHRYPGIAFLFVDGRLTRIDVTSPAWPTGADIAVADAATKILATHPGVGSQTVRGALVFTVNAPGGARALRYVTDGTRVNALSAGETASVENEEKCA